MDWSNFIIGMLCGAMLVAMYGFFLINWVIVKIQGMEIKDGG